MEHADTSRLDARWVIVRREHFGRAVAARRTDKSQVSARGLRQVASRVSAPGGSRLDLGIPVLWLSIIIGKGSTMRGTAMAFRLGATVLCTALLVSSRPAMPLTGLSGLSTAIEQASAVQKMSYICRHGSQGRRCRHVSRPYLRYGTHPYYQPRRNVGEPPYNPYYWGGPLGNFPSPSYRN
jgi:hypothetical protein